MSDEQFRLLKDRLYRASNALQLSLESCPDLQNIFVELEDGHKLKAMEVFLLLGKMRSEVWKYGPSKTQLRHIKGLLRNQARG